VNAPRFAKVIVVVVFGICCPRLGSAADLTLAWDPPSDGITTGYILFYGTAPQSYSLQVDVGFTTSYTLNGLADGTTYYFAVRAHDPIGDMSNLSNEVYATTLAGVPPVVTALALTANLPSPQVVGTTVTWLSTAGGGVAPYEFQWALYQAGNWTAWPWTLASTWTWTPSTSGNDYQVRVAARSSGSSSTSGEVSQSVPFTVTAPPVASVTLQANVASPQIAGSTILWSAAALGGVAPYQYRWWVFDGSVWSAATAWTTSSTWSWTPTVANNGYIVRVWVRGAGSSTDAAEASASVPFPIKSAPRKCQGPKCK
jgi:hypothetical protein